MPKFRYDSPPSKYRDLCETCGKKVDTTLRTHYMKVHQSQCKLSYSGSVKVANRHKDGTWHCPHCPAKFLGYPMNLQEHVKLNHYAEAEETEVVKVERKGSRAEIFEPPSDGMPYHDENDVSWDEEAAVAATPKSQSDIRQTSKFSARPSRLHQTRQTARSQRPRSPLRARPASLTSSPADLRAEASPSPAVSRVKPRIPAIPTSSASPQSRTSTSPPLKPSDPPTEPSQALSAPPALPPALDAFFNSLRVPLHHLGDIFVKYGFDSEETLNLLCELAPEAGWAQMRSEIEQRSKLSGWLAIQLGLQERAERLASKKPSA